MDLKLQDKIILVAASSKGLGYAIARTCSQEGAKVVLGSRTVSDVHSAAASIQDETGGTVIAQSLDASDTASITSWIQTSVERFGQIDGLVVNAGGPPAGKFGDFSDSDWQAAFELTLLSSVRMIREVLPLMKSPTVRFDSYHNFKLYSRAYRELTVIQCVSLGSGQPAKKSSK